MTSIPPPPIASYLDRLALALSAAATWWREQLAERTNWIPAEKLDNFERHLCLGMAKLLLENAVEHGLSYRSWAVRVYRTGPDAVLKAAAASAGIQGVPWPFYTRMWLKSTADQVHVRVQQGHYDKARQVWPLVTSSSGASGVPATGDLVPHQPVSSRQLAPPSASR